MSPSGAITSLQALRAVAAIAVVGFHASWRAGEAWAVGQAGVDIFFVLSGFIMWVLRERGASPLGFAIDRILRIAPLYWLASVGMVAGALLGLFPNLTLEFAHVAASFLFAPYPAPGSGELWPILVQGWTLNYEMFFYALFALALILPRAAQLPVLCSVLVALTCAGALFELRGVAAFYTSPLLLEFAAGACIGAAWTANAMPGARLAWLLVLGALAYFLVASVYALQTPRLLAWGAPAACLLAGVAALERRGFACATPSLVFLGDASYAIYLFHTFAISLVARLFGAKLGFWPEMLLGLLAGVGAGVAVHVVIEAPMNRFIKRLRRGGRGEAPGGVPGARAFG